MRDIVNDIVVCMPGTSGSGREALWAVHGSDNQRTTDSPPYKEGKSEQTLRIRFVLTFDFMEKIDLNDIHITKIVAVNLMLGTIHSISNSDVE